MTNYRRGYDIERKIVNQLKKEGYVAVRTAGSHSLFDVIAINEDEILLIQAKRTKTGYINADENVHKFADMEVPKGVLKRLWIWEDRKGFRKLQL